MMETKLDKVPRGLLEAYEGVGGLFYSTKLLSQINKREELAKVKIEADRDGFYRLTNNLAYAVVEAMIPEELRTKYQIRFDYSKSSAFLTLSKEVLEKIKTETKSKFGVVCVLDLEAFEKIPEGKYRHKYPEKEVQAIAKIDVSYDTLLNDWLKEKEEKGGEVVLRF